jgi:hypothetical protein
MIAGNAASPFPKERRMNDTPKRRPGRPKGSAIQDQELQARIADLLVSRRASNVAVATRLAVKKEPGLARVHSKKALVRRMQARFKENRDTLMAEARHRAAARQEAEHLARAASTQSTFGGLGLSAGFLEQLNPKALQILSDQVLGFDKTARNIRALVVVAETRQREFEAIGRKLSLMMEGPLARARDLEKMQRLVLPYRLG